MIRIRLLSSPKPDWSDPRIEFDPSISLESCDGLLAWGAMTPEFLSYKGPRAWYLDEALTHSMFKTPLFKKALQELAPNEFLHHSNPDPQYRFPCATHYGELTLGTPPSVRKDAAIAVVSNFGGRIWWLRRGVRLRNRFILHPGVDLFGNAESWSRFRRWPWSMAGPPPNYRGPFTSEWRFHDHVGALAQYARNVCLENVSLPYYFTEKLVNAARAGCVPIYHAHPTVRDTFLQGAFWIDPADFAFDASATLAAAADCDAAKVREQNYAWLKSENVKITDGYRIWSGIADHFVARITPKP